MVDGAGLGQRKADCRLDQRLVGLADLDALLGLISGVLLDTLVVGGGRVLEVGLLVLLELVWGAVTRVLGAGIVDSGAGW